MMRSTMLFLLVTLLGLTASAGAHCHKVNVALAGKATQSNQYEHIFAHASNAIDGNRNPNYYDGSCSHTRQQTNSWWRVDLLQSHHINSVVITNRGDCCETRIYGAEIRIGDSLDNNGINNPRCAVISSISAGGTSTFRCNDMVGRYVTVVIPRNEYLHLCEVEVYGRPHDNQNEC
ncbi:fucolectin isoform X1 [Esox lucius]|uniref:Fucolectin-4 n=1 Tax=Esox lucius TaxID=8010 RepID=C1BYM4_ESOLU|nr:fucolectin precursor [Esox lucius]XP_010901085.1 fucolectin isoform X1 [Esox lucius]ACO14127.1 Fucolectin-4 precursor [Esox lucius]